MSDDNFVPPNDGIDAPPALKRESSTMSAMRSSVIRKKADPYHLDFSEMRKDYEQKSSVKIPFVKSSFVHYSKCPRNMVINGKEYKDLVVTMELIQAPETLKYNQLTDPVAAKKLKKMQAKEEAREKRLAEQRAKKQAK